MPLVGDARRRDVQGHEEGKDAAEEEEGGGEDAGAGGGQLAEKEERYQAIGAEGQGAVAGGLALRERGGMMRDGVRRC